LTDGPAGAKKRRRPEEKAQKHEIEKIWKSRGTSGQEREKKQDRKLLTQKRENMGRGLVYRTRKADWQMVNSGVKMGQSVDEGKRGEKWGSGSKPLAGENVKGETYGIRGGL